LPIGLLDTARIHGKPGNRTGLPASNHKDLPVSPAAAIAIEDLALVEQTQQGDMAAFGRLVTKYQDRVYNTCWRLCGNVEDARDLTQDAFLRALQAIDRFQGKAGFYTWLFRIAVNLAISHRRKGRHAVQLSLHDSDGTRLIDSQAAGLVRRIGPRGMDPSVTMETREAHRVLLRVLEEMDDEFRTVLVLRDVESFDYHEIGEILDVPPGTVKSRLHRARMALREKLAPWMDRGDGQSSAQRPGERPDPRAGERPGSSRP
jgi:RNA polymerase sigma-70 factor, ECF subfamily